MFAPRRFAVVAKTALDVAVLSAAFCLAFLIRFEGSLSADYFRAMVLALPFVLAVKLLCFAALGVRRLTWRHVSLVEAKRIFVSLWAATVMLLALRLETEALYRLQPSLRSAQVPLSVLLMDLPLSFLGVMGMRVWFRAWVERSGRGAAAGRQRAKVPTLLIGAGRAGVLVAKEIAAGGTAIEAVGFLDDRPGQVGSVIHGLPVLGTVAELPRIVKQRGARQALIALEGASGADIRRVARACEGCGVTAKIIPEILEIVQGRIDLSRAREVAIEDLLRREPVRLDGDAIAAVIRGRKVLITGAGGSIGSELCRIVSRFAPEELVLVEQAENGLFFIHRELGERYPDLRTVPCIADICERRRIADIFAMHRPAVVFHAAAHKHVPLMEWNPGEAVKNNILGTRNLADVADAAGVGEFVMISTDKAVRPSSVMGVSKRVAEIYVQALAQRSRTRFVMVRFGNVLGSNGSVLPIFREQIARGGPVTVTHPDMTRYFMTIPEACQLVLQAASMGKGGEVFILDMGEPVKIMELAHDLIRLSGLRPGRDIEIRITGIRPGEKLSEELSLEEEGACATSHPRILIGRPKVVEWELVTRHLEELARLALGTDAGPIHAKLKEVVPEYQYHPSPLPGHTGGLRLDPPQQRGGPNWNGPVAAPLPHPA